MYINDNKDTIKTPLAIKAGIFLAGVILGFFILRIFFTPFVVADES